MLEVLGSIWEAGRPPEHQKAAQRLQVEHQQQTRSFGECHAHEKGSPFWGVCAFMCYFMFLEGLTHMCDACCFDAVCSSLGAQRLPKLYFLKGADVAQA